MKRNLILTAFLALNFAFSGIGSLNASKCNINTVLAATQGAFGLYMLNMARKDILEYAARERPLNPNPESISKSNTEILLSYCNSTADYPHNYGKLLVLAGLIKLTSAYLLCNNIRTTPASLFLAHCQLWSTFICLSSAVGIPLFSMLTGIFIPTGFGVQSLRASLAASLACLVSSLATYCKLII